MPTPLIDTPISEIPPAFRQAVRQLEYSLLPACIIWKKDQLLACNKPLTVLVSPNTWGKALTDLPEPFWHSVTAALPRVMTGIPELIEEAEISRRYFTIALSPLLVDDGQIGGAILIFIETTATRVAEQNLQTMIRHAPVAMAAFRGKDLVVEAANQKVCEMWGKPYPECIGKPIFDIMPEVRNQGFEDLVSRVMDKGESVEIAEMPVMKIHDGLLQQRFMTFSYEPLRTLEGRIEGMVTVGLDVTDSIHIRKEHNEAQERTRIAVEAAAIGIFELVLATDEIITSERFDDIFGLPASRAHADYFKVIHPDDLAQWKESVQTALGTGRLFQQYRIFKPGGETAWVQTFGRVCYDSGGQPERVLGTAIDVTLQVRAQQHSQLLLNSMPTIAWTNDPNGEVNFYNQRWYEYTGLTFEETKAWGWKEVIHPDDLQYNLDTYANILASNAGGTFEVREKRADGAYRWHLVNVEPIKDAAGKIVQWVGTATDIQQLKNLERQKDEFVSIASHELKTPLTSIKAFNQLMLRSADPKALADFAVKSKDHVARLEKLINDLLDVSRISAGQLVYDMKDFAIEKVLAESVESVQLTTQKHEIIIEGCDQLVFFGDVDRLEQVLNNLLNNAVKYSPHGGTIRVSCNVDATGVVVAVADQGIGIEKQHLAKLFDRYYRIDNTAMRFSGLGLGLFISSEIIKRHGGSLWIESEPGAGSTFYFRLPLSHVASVVADELALYQDNWITIQYDAANKRVSCEWHGHQNIHSIQRSCLRLLTMVEQFKVSKILADNTYVEGTWTDATDWVAKQYYPMLEKAGVRQLAWVHSKSVFSQLAAEKTVDLAIGAVTTRFFGDVESAGNWLNINQL